MGALMSSEPDREVKRQELANEFQLQLDEDRAISIHTLKDHGQMHVFLPNGGKQFQPLGRSEKGGTTYTWPDPEPACLVLPFEKIWTFTKFKDSGSGSVYTLEEAFGSAHKTAEQFVSLLNWAVLTEQVISRLKSVDYGDKTKFETWRRELRLRHGRLTPQEKAYFHTPELTASALVEEVKSSFLAAVRIVESRQPIRVLFLGAKTPSDCPRFDRQKADALVPIGRLTRHDLAKETDTTATVRHAYTWPVPYLVRPLSIYRTWNELTSFTPEVTFDKKRDERVGRERGDYAARESARLPGFGCVYAVGGPKEATELVSRMNWPSLKSQIEGRLRDVGDGGVTRYETWRSFLATPKEKAVYETVESTASAMVAHIRSIVLLSVGKPTQL